jgi:uncharacterized protein (DUF433 family)
LGTQGLPLALYSKAPEHIHADQTLGGSQRPGDLERYACVHWDAVPVQSLFDYLEGGDTVDEFLRQFPSVTRAQAIAVLEFGRDSLLTSARSA